MEPDEIPHLDPVQPWVDYRGGQSCVLGCGKYIEALESASIPIVQTRHAVDTAVGFTRRLWHPRCYADALGLAWESDLPPDWKTFLIIADRDRGGAFGTVQDQSETSEFEQYLSSIPEAYRSVEGDIEIEERVISATDQMRLAQDLAGVAAWQSVSYKRGRSTYVAVVIYWPKGARP
jgi:hypothetical protein